MARKKSKQVGVGNKEQSLSKSPGGGGDAGAAARSAQVALAHPANQANSNQGLNYSKRPRVGFIAHYVGRRMRY